MNMKALISTIEPRETGYRVAQVEQDGNIFPLAEGMFWADCDESIIADQFWYDPSDRLFKPVPSPQTVVGENQPAVNGAETL